MSNEIDLEHDEEWLALIAGFRTHFWQVRVPELLIAWAEARVLPLDQWTSELKRAIHGIAGSAGLIGYEAIGNEARSVEQAWDSKKLSTEALTGLIDAFAQHVAELANDPQ